jgi:hypothetical protein
MMPRCEVCSSPLAMHWQLFEHEPICRVHEAQQEAAKELVTSYLLREGALEAERQQQKARAERDKAERVAKAKWLLVAKHLEPRPTFGRGGRGR